jgi:hypothetical protein
MRQQLTRDVNSSRLSGAIAFIAFIVLQTPNLSLGADWEYRIKLRDTLIGLSNRYFIDPSRWPEFQRLNGVKNPRRLQPGAILLMPVEWLKQEPTQAAVSSIQGSAVVNVGGEEKPLAVGTLLNTGDIIRTDANSSLSVRFIDGSQALLLKDSTLKLDNLTAYPNTGMANTQLKLETGRVETQVKPLKGAAARYEIRTPMAQLGVRGTDFRVGSDLSSNTGSTEVLSGAVQAANEAGTVDVQQGFGTVIALGKPPSPPIELLPAPDLSSVPPLIERTPIRFRWQPMAKASGYRVQIERDRQFNVVLNEDVFVTPEASFPDLPDGQYAMRVRAIDTHGLEGLNADREITVKARPEPPFLQAPEDQSTQRGDRLDFTWAKVGEAAGYHFQLASDSSLKSPLLEERNWADTHLATPKPLVPGQYFWRVASRRTSGDLGPFGDVQQFTLKAIPMVEGGAARPVLNDKSLTLQWKSGPPGQTYQLQLARNREFSPLLKEEAVAEPKIEFQRPAGGLIYMRVKAIDSDGFEGPYGAPQEIEVAPNYPVIKLVADNSTAKFNWPAGLEGQKLQLQVARSARFEPLLLDTTTDATEAQIKRPAGSEFFVRSRRIDPDGYVETFSKLERVTLSEPFAQLETPKLEKGEITFNWSKPLSGQKFRFQLARDAAFNSAVHDATLAENTLVLKNPGAGRYFVRVGVIDQDGFVAPYGPTQQFDVPRNYWPLLLLLPLLLL